MTEEYAPMCVNCGHTPNVHSWSTELAQRTRCLLGGCQCEQFQYPQEDITWKNVGYCIQLLQTPRSTPLGWDAVFEAPPMGLRMIGATGRTWQIISWTGDTPVVGHFFRFLLNDTDSYKLMDVKRDLEAFRALLPPDVARQLPCNHLHEIPYLPAAFWEADGDLKQRYHCPDCGKTYDKTIHSPYPREYLDWMQEIAQTWAHGFIRLSDEAIRLHERLRPHLEEQKTAPPAIMSRVGLQPIDHIFIWTATELLKRLEHDGRKIGILETVPCAEPGSTDPFDQCKLREVEALCETAHPWVFPSALPRAVGVELARNWNEVRERELRVELREAEANS